MSRPKHLLGLKALEEGNALLDQGVPLSKVHARLDPEWHYLSTYMIFKVDRHGRHQVTRPPWLKAEPVLQAPPDDWTFDGNFPNGRWVKK